MNKEREILDKTIEDAQKVIDDAKAKRAELDKPKLRHGDVNIKNGLLATAHNTISNIRWTDCAGHTEPNSAHLHSNFNVFDDIAKKTEELEEFHDRYQAVSLGAKCDMYGVSVTHRKGYDFSWITTENAQEFCDNIQKVINCARNKK